MTHSSESRTSLQAYVLIGFTMCWWSFLSNSNVLTIRHGDRGLTFVFKTMISLVNRDLQGSVRSWVCVVRIWAYVASWSFLNEARIVHNGSCTDVCLSYRCKMSDLESGFEPAWRYYIVTSVVSGVGTTWLVSLLGSVGWKPRFNSALPSLIMRVLIT